MARELSRGRCSGEDSVWRCDTPEGMRCGDPPAIVVTAAMISMSFSTDDFDFFLIRYFPESSGFI